MTTPASDTPHPEPTPTTPRPAAADSAPTDALPAEAVADAAVEVEAATADAAPADSALADAVPAAVVADAAAGGNAATVVPAPSDAVPADIAPADSALGDAVPAEAVADAAAEGHSATVVPAPAEAVPADTAPAEGDSATVILAAVPASADVASDSGSGSADAAPADAVAAGGVADAVAAGDAAPVAPAPADDIPADSGPADAVAKGDSATVILAAATAAPDQAGGEPLVAESAAAVGEDAAPAPAAEGAADSSPVVLAKAAPVAESVPTIPAQATGPDPRVPAPVAASAAQTAQTAQTAQPAPGVPAQAYPPPGFGQPYPLQQPVPGGTVWAVPGALQKERKPRPWLRTVGRWVTAAAVATVVGVVSAVLVTQPARTDIPGLKTPADGRYTFPALTLPTLPPAQAGLPAPQAGIHQVDLRELLLPAPVGAKADTTLPGRNGWVSAGSFIGLLSSPTLLKATFDDAGLRHIAATGWTMPDGTHTAIYLQQFRSAIGSTAVDSVESTAGDLAVAVGPMPDPSVTLVSTLDASSVRRASAQGGKPSVLYGYFTVGDTELLVVMSNPKQVPTVDFEQVADLQDRLLGAS